MKFSRKWAMPSGDTFSIPCIADFVRRYVTGVVVDPFARNSTFGTITNDLNPETSAQHHMDARAFLAMCKDNDVKADVGIFDPPYSPHQIVVCYQGFGRKPTQNDTQNGKLYRECRDIMRELIVPGGWALSFGWNSCGFGEGFETKEILLVSHGGAHNDTICCAHQKAFRGTASIPADV